MGVDHSGSGRDRLTAVIQSLGLASSKVRVRRIFLGVLGLEGYWPTIYVFGPLFYFIFLFFFFFNMHL